MIREDWAEIKLKDLVKNPKKDIVDGPFGSNLKACEYIDEGIPVFKIQNIKANRFLDKNIRYVTEEKANTLDRHSFIAGDLILTKLGDPLGLCCEVPKKYPYGIIVADLLRLRPNEDIVNKNYLQYCLNSNYTQVQLRSITKGTTRPRVNLTIVRDLRFPFTPLPEQRAIVAKIEQLFSDLDSGIADLKKAQSQLKIYRQAVLKKAFEGELTKEWREKQTNLPTAEELLAQIKEERQNYYNKQLEQWKTAVKTWENEGKVGKKPGKPKPLQCLFPLSTDEQNELCNIPHCWAQTKMANISLDITDGDHQAPPKANVGVPFITISNIFENKIDFSNTFYVSLEYFNSLPKYRTPRFGDILYTVTGSFGIPVLVNFEKRFCFQRHIGLIRPLALTDNNWLYWLLQTRMIFMQALDKATGTAQKTIGLTSIRNFITPICSLQEQHQIVQEIETRLSVCDKVEQTITESLEKAEALRQSILKKAFEGRLLSEAELAACKKEKDYEPASELLKKIKAEKLKNEAKMKSKKSSKLAK